MTLFEFFNSTGFDINRDSPNGDLCWDLMASDLNPQVTD